jgi:hypothetical protein
MFFVEDHLGNDGWIIAHDLARPHATYSVAVGGYALQCRLYVGCSGPRSEVAGVDYKGARSAANSEAMSWQRPILCGGQDVGLLCIVDGGRYSVCARYL